MEATEKKVIIMRGLPWTGKSYRANELKGENGLIYSTDEYWYKVRKPDQPEHYSFNPRYLGDAHRWNQQRFDRSVELGHPLIIVDNTMTTGSEALHYAQYASWQDYQIVVEEPTSERWLEIRELLRDKRGNKKELKDWANKLAEGSKTTHGVPAWSIERMMWRWECDLTVEAILNSQPLPTF